MRRKARLKVLYWPIIASTCIILILIGFGPLSSLLRPTMAHLWAGCDLEGKVGHWLPGVFLKGRSVTFPSMEVAANRSAGGSGARPASAPRTLANQNANLRQLHAVASLDARQDVDATTQPRSIHSPHALRMLAGNEVALQAEVKLFAPRRDDAEEMAGVERSSASKTRLASQGSTGSSSLFLDATANARTYVGDDVRDDSQRSTDLQRCNHGIGGGWPETTQLNRDLDDVVRVSAQRGTIRFASTGRDTFSIEDWRTNVSDSLRDLSSLSSVTSPETGAVLTRLQSLATEGHEAAESIEDREIQIRMLRAAHGLDRRIAVWSAVWRTTQGTVQRISDMSPEEDAANISDDEIARLIDELRDEANASDDADGWFRFLMIDELAETNRSSDLAARRITAQRFLSRMSWHRLSESQVAWLDRPSIRNLSISLRRWAAQPLDYSGLLAQIERQESDAIDLGGIDVASAVQTLRFAESREANRIADALNTHYRNANIRVAVTSELITKMIPEVDAKVQPVRDNILGADVRGTSVAKSDLSLRLIPSSNTWRMVLENNGRVDTGANSRQWPVLIRSDSNASFQSSTPLEITPEGAVAGSTSVAVQSATRVRGVSTEFDSIPLINSLVREIAMNRYESMAPLAKQIQTNKIRGGVSSEVDSRVSEQLDEATATLARRLTGPLGTLRLSPLVVDMQTSESRLSARYRVAGDWQLAAFTPRPRAPLASLMSVQVHQSAFNNTLETILPSGEAKTINELIQDIRTLFGVENPIALGEEDELAGDISIQFASTRPITIEIEDDILWVTMRVIRLKQDRAIDLRRFIVRAGYRPQVNCMSAQLVREGHLRISGPEMSMRDRLPVRAIFNKVFSTRRPLPIISEQWANHPSASGLAVTQAELRDGWLAIAIGNASDAFVTSQIARAEEDESSSSQTF